MKTDTNQDAYQRHIERVINYICSHLDEELSLDHLSEVAGFSKFHFHRQSSLRTVASPWPSS
jgi:AraC family transcriptional regulator